MMSIVFALPREMVVCLPIARFAGFAAFLTAFFFAGFLAGFFLAGFFFVAGFLFDAGFFVVGFFFVAMIGSLLGFFLVEELLFHYVKGSVLFRITVLKHQQCTTTSLLTDSITTSLFLGADLLLVLAADTALDELVVLADYFCLLWHVYSSYVTTGYA